MRLFWVHKGYHCHKLPQGTHYTSIYDDYQEYATDGLTRQKEKIFSCDWTCFFCKTDAADKTELNGDKTVAETSTVYGWQSEK
ncbi:hypothetical protein C0J52_28212 [Blattella germanica]|nr:hypothetical protein C0J52_28212 [Blattella germanica]